MTVWEREREHALALLTNLTFIYLVRQIRHSPIYLYHSYPVIEGKSIRDSLALQLQLSHDGQVVAFSACNAAFSAAVTRCNTGQHMILRIA